MYKTKEVLSGGLGRFNRQISILVGLALLMLAPGVGNACMAFPTPASCSAQLVKKLKGELHGQHRYLRGLEKRVRSQKKLLIGEIASAANRPGIRTNIDLIANPKLKSAAMAGTPIAFAGRLEALHPKLTAQEWNRGVRLWADYIARSEDLWEAKDYEQFCGLQQEGKSLVVDAGYIFVWPFVLFEMGKNGDPTQNAASVLTLGPLVSAAGVVSLGADVLTFIPNVAANGGKRLRANIHVRLSARAFRKFADYVVKKERGEVSESIPNFHEVSPGVYRGGQPTAAGWKMLKAKGVKTVVKLDLASEGSDAGATALGMTVIDASGPPSDLGDMLGAPKPERLRLAVKTLRDEKLRPVFVHCLHGQDRTGLVVGLYRVLHDHASKSAAYAEMRKYGFHHALHGLREVWEGFDGKTITGDAPIDK